MQSRISVLSAVPICTQSVRLCHVPFPWEYFRNYSCKRRFEKQLCFRKLRFEECLWFLHVFMDKETGIFVNPSWKHIDARQYQKHFEKHYRKQGRCNVSNRICRFQMQLPFQYKHWKLFFLFYTGSQSIATSVESYCDKKTLLAVRSCGCNVPRDVLGSRFALRGILPNVSSRDDITDTFLWHPLVTNLISNLSHYMVYSTGVWSWFHT